MFTPLNLPMTGATSSLPKGRPGSVSYECAAAAVSALRRATRLAFLKSSIRFGTNTLRMRITPTDKFTALSAKPNNVPSPNFTTPKITKEIAAPND